MENFSTIISFFLWITCYPFQEISSSDTTAIRLRIPPVQENFTREFTKFFPFYDREGIPGRILANPKEYRECLFDSVYTAPITLFLSCPTLFYEDGSDFCAYRYWDTRRGHSEDSRCSVKRAQMYCTVMVWSPFQEEINERTTWLNIRSYRYENNDLESIKNSTFSTSYSHFLLLNLGQNDIVRLEPFAFTYLPNLQYLTLEENRIEELQDNTFHGLTQLRGLVLTQNKITDLRKYSFTPLQNLTLLYLNHNKIRTIEDSTFVNLKKLKILVLKGNELSQLTPNTFQNLKNLDMLHLAENQIETLERNVFHDLEKLRSLILNKNKISEIKRGALFGLYSLIELELQDNDINYLPRSTFKDLKILSYINLQNNPLQMVQDDIFLTLGNLQTLIIDKSEVCCLLKKTEKMIDCSADYDEISNSDGENQWSEYEEPELKKNTDNDDSDNLQSAVRVSESKSIDNTNDRGTNTDDNSNTEAYLFEAKWPKYKSDDYNEIDKDDAFRKFVEKISKFKSSQNTDTDYNKNEILSDELSLLAKHKVKNSTNMCNDFFHEKGRNYRYKLTSIDIFSILICSIAIVFTIVVFVTNVRSCLGNRPLKCTSSKQNLFPDEKF